jgi:dimethylargininase
MMSYLKVFQSMPEQEIDATENESEAALEKMFTDAIVRLPCRNLVRGITTAGLGLPDFDLALEQHQAYVTALEQCGLRVKVLQAEEAYPDSVFIEDTALITTRCAIMTYPGADSRRGEATTVAAALLEYFSGLQSIEAPGTLDAGDVMMVEDHYYVGLSSRTNHDGADQLIAMLNQHGLSGSKVHVADGLHLKSSISYLEDNKVLITSDFMLESQFSSFQQIQVPEEEAYAANAVWVNGRVLVASGYPHISDTIQQAGLNVIELDMSEFQKMDGGLSCLSLRFSRPDFQVG